MILIEFVFQCVWWAPDIQGAASTACWGLLTLFLVVILESELHTHLGTSLLAHIPAECESVCKSYKRDRQAQSERPTAKSTHYARQSEVAGLNCVLWWLVPPATATRNAG